MTLPETDTAFALRLQTIFVAEARALVAQLDAGLAALTPAGAGQQTGRVAPLRETLHTLKGAARSVGLLELEYLCHALESVFAARPGTTLTPAQVARMRPAVGMAGLLLMPAEGRTRNQAMALIAQLEALAREPAAG